MSASIKDVVRTPLNTGGKKKKVSRRAVIDIPSVVTEDVEGVYPAQYPLHAYIASPYVNASDLFSWLKQHNHFDINSRDSNGKTLLELAVQKNNLEMVKVLLQHGANFDFFNIIAEPEDKTSYVQISSTLFLAVQQFEAMYEQIHGVKPIVANYLRALNKLQMQIENEIPLEVAVKAKDLNLVVYYVQKENFSVHTVNEQGFNVLDQALAIEKNHVKHNEATQIAVVLRNKGMEFTDKKQAALDSVYFARNENIRAFVNELNAAHSGKKINFNIDKFITKIGFMGIEYDPINKSQPFSFDESKIESATLLAPQFFTDFVLPNQIRGRFTFRKVVKLPEALQKKYDNLRNFFLDPTQSGLLEEYQAREHLESLRSNSLLADYTAYKVSALPNDAETVSRLIYVDAANHRCKFKYNDQTHEADLGEGLGLDNLVQDPEVETAKHIKCKQRILNCLNAKGFSVFHQMYTSSLDIAEAKEIVQIVIDKKACEDNARAKLNTYLGLIGTLDSEFTIGLGPCIKEMGALVEKMHALEKDKSLSSAIIEKKLNSITCDMEQLHHKTTQAFEKLVELEQEISYTAQKFSYLSEAAQLNASLAKVKIKKVAVQKHLKDFDDFKREMSELLSVTKNAEKNIATAEDLHSELDEYAEEVRGLISGMRNLKASSNLSSAEMHKSLDEIEIKISVIEVKAEEEIPQKREKLEKAYASIDDKFNDFSKVTELKTKTSHLAEQEKSFSSLVEKKAAVKKEVETTIFEKATAERFTAEKVSALKKLTEKLNQCEMELEQLEKVKLVINTELSLLAEEIGKESTLIDKLKNPTVTKDLLIQKIDKLVEKHRHLDTGFFRSIGNSAKDKILAKELAKIKKALIAAQGLREISNLAKDLRVSVKEEFLEGATENKDAFPMSASRKQLLEELSTLCLEREDIESKLESEETVLKSCQEILGRYEVEKMELNEVIENKTNRKEALEEKIAELKKIVGDFEAESQKLSTKALARSNAIPSVSALTHHGVFSNDRNKEESSFPPQNDHTDIISVGLGMPIEAVGT